jgi:preprotein translocase subunit SecA
MGPVYRLLGLSVGVVQHGQSPAERRAAYAADVTYCTNKELAFDYLRDRIALDGERGELRLRLGRHLGADRRLDQLYLRGLYFAIVDEVDSVLIDEARTPLIISAGEEGAGDAGPYATALEMARTLAREDDFAVDLTARVARLTEAGRARVALLSADLPGAWRSERGREELVVQALSALHLFERDRHYIVVEDKVQIVDEFTGRVMADRSWERGLHQTIEVKEGCAVSGRRVTQAKVTYQHFFRRYLLLGGMSGTVMEVSPELWSVYRLRSVRVPTNRPILRVDRGMRMLRASEDRWRAVVQATARVRGEGRPVLIGTRSVAASEQLSGLLAAAGIEHRVLNARFDSEEAAIIARAGLSGAVTVATNMAGRGTDILLGPGVAEAGGLHVILTEFHESARIDRQLFGRCGRQGDPGSHQAVVSLEDDLFTLYAPRARAAVSGSAAGEEIPARRAAWLVRNAQAAAELAGVRIRRATFDSDRQLDQTLGFAGGLK